MSFESFAKAPHAMLDFKFNWAYGYLEDGETITSYSIIADGGITVDSSSKSGNKVIVWLSGGRVGHNYNVTCRAITSFGRTDDKTMQIRVRQT